MALLICKVRLVDNASPWEELRSRSMSVRYNSQPSRNNEKPNRIISSHGQLAHENLKTVQRGISPFKPSVDRMKLQGLGSYLVVDWGGGEQAGQVGAVLPSATTSLRVFVFPPRLAKFVFNTPSARRFRTLPQSLPLMKGSNRHSAGVDYLLCHKRELTNSEGLEGTDCGRRWHLLTMIKGLFEMSSPVNHSYLVSEWFRIRNVHVRPWSE